MRVNLLLYFCLAFHGCIASDSLHTKKLNLMGGVGPSWYSGEAGVPLHVNTSLDKSGFGYSLRLMYEPEYRLSVGVETARLPVYAYRINDVIKGDLRLRAIPLLLVWGFRPFDNFYLYGGSGTYFVRTSLRYAGEVNTGNLNIGWMLACQYRKKLTDRFALAGEFKWYDISESHDATLNLQVQMIWSLFKW